MIVLYDTLLSRSQLYPLSLTRPLADLLAGTTTLKNWWASLSNQQVACLSEAYLTAVLPASDIYYCIDATVLPEVSLCSSVLQLQPGEQLQDENGIFAFCTTTAPMFGHLPDRSTGQSLHTAVKRFHHAATLVQLNPYCIAQAVSATHLSLANEKINSSNTVIGNQLYMASTANMQACIVNTLDGPVMIDEDALVMEGCIIRGPVYIGKGTVVKAGAKIYAGTSIGQQCTVGGEIKQSIIHSFSNKAHDGYLGDSYIGAWCNLGAGTSNSNIKNTAGEVQVWHQAVQGFVDAGLKAGTIMGDYSRTAINTSINTGCCIGVSCSLQTSGLITGHIPSFSWGNTEKYLLPKAIEHIQNWMQLKGQQISEQQMQTLTNVYNHHSA